MTDKIEVVICGAGIAGVSAAYFLATKYGIRNIILVDERPPLSLTSDHSTECYRNWWQGPDGAMIELVNNSIDLMEKLALTSANVFHMNRRGYLYCSDDNESLNKLHQSAVQIAQLGAGDLRIHQTSRSNSTYQPAPANDYLNQPDGADLILDPHILHEYFPYLSSSIKGALHIRRAGWLSAQQLGAYLLDQARQAGVRFVSGKVVGIDLSGGQVDCVVLHDRTVFPTNHFVDAAGPYLQNIASLLDIELPIYHELHLKMAIKDNLGVLDRSAPLVIWNDPQILEWTSDEQAFLLEDQNSRQLLGCLPSGVHTRPEGAADSQIILVLWEYRSRLLEPVFPIPEDPLYAEVALRGLVRMIPGMRPYLQRLPRPRVDGGYYTRTRENRPLIGKLPVDGAYIIGALSGFGIMAACGAGELLARHIAGDVLPGYASAFSLERYNNPQYLSLIEKWGSTGQL